MTFLFEISMRRKYTEDNLLEHLTSWLLAICRIFDDIHLFINVVLPGPYVPTRCHEMLTKLLWESY